MKENISSRLAIKNFVLVVWLCSCQTIIKQRMKIIWRTFSKNDMLRQSLHKPREHQACLHSNHMQSDWVDQKPEHDTQQKSTYLNVKRTLQTNKLCIMLCSNWNASSTKWDRGICSVTQNSGTCYEGMFQPRNTLAHNKCIGGGFMMHHFLLMEVNWEM